MHNNKKKIIFIAIVFLINSICNVSFANDRWLNFFSYDKFDASYDSTHFSSSKGSHMQTVSAWISKDYYDVQEYHGIKFKRVLSHEIIGYHYASKTISYETHEFLLYDSNGNVVSSTDLRSYGSRNVIPGSVGETMFTILLNINP